MMNDYVLSIQARTTLLREPPGRCNPAWGSPKILAADQLEQKGDAQGGMHLIACINYALSGAFSHSPSGAMSEDVPVGDCRGALVWAWERP